MEPPAKVLADLRAGKYYFELNEGDLDCIDWDYQTNKMFYAIPKERVLYDSYKIQPTWCKSCREYDDCYKSEEEEEGEEGGPEETEEAEADATSALNTAFIGDESKEGPKEG
jgi:hypothetical protein